MWKSGIYVDEKVHIWNINEKELTQNIHLVQTIVRQSAANTMLQVKEQLCFGTIISAVCNCLTADICNKSFILNSIDDK